MPDLLKAVEAPANQNVPDLKPGDNVSVHVRIVEGNKERVQEFKGTIIRLRKGGNDANFTVRRVASHGIGVERTFLLRSPRIETAASHGTGCTLASAVAANLCLGKPLRAACSEASDYVHRALRSGYRPGRGGVVVLDHFGAMG